MYAIVEIIFGIIINDEVVSKVTEKLKELNLEEEWEAADFETYGCTQRYSGHMKSGDPAYFGISLDEFEENNYYEISELVDVLSDKNSIMEQYKEFLNSEDVPEWARDVFSRFEPKYQIFWSTS